MTSEQTEMSPRSLGTAPAVGAVLINRRTVMNMIVSTTAIAAAVPATAHTFNDPAFAAIDRYERAFAAHSEFLNNEYYPLEDRLMDEARDFALAALANDAPTQALKHLCKSEDLERVAWEKWGVPRLNELHERSEDWHRTVARLPDFEEELERAALAVARTVPTTLVGAIAMLGLSQLKSEYHWDLSGSAEQDDYTTLEEITMASVATFLRSKLD